MYVCLEERAATTAGRAPLRCRHRFRLPRCARWRDALCLLNRRSPIGAALAKLWDLHGSVSAQCAAITGRAAGSVACGPRPGCAGIRRQHRSAAIHNPSGRCGARRRWSHGPVSRAGRQLGASGAEIVAHSVLRWRPSTGGRPMAASPKTGERHPKEATRALEDSASAGAVQGFGSTEHAPFAGTHIHRPTKDRRQSALGRDPRHIGAAPDAGGDTAPWVPGSTSTRVVAARSTRRTEGQAHPRHCR